MEIEFVSTQDDKQNGVFNCWFNVDGESYAISSSVDGKRLLDCDGCPVEPCNDHDNVCDALMAYYRKNIDHSATA